MSAEKAMGEALLLFGLAGTRELASAVASRLGIALAEHAETDFEDGEHKSRPLVGVRGRDVYVLASLHSDERHSVNDKLCRLLFFLGALRDAAAGRITAVVPYLCYMREDRKIKPNDPVITRYVARLFEAVEVDAVVVIDVHNLAAFQNAFRCRTEHLEAAPAFANELRESLGDEPLVVVSPDLGGVNRAERFRGLLVAALQRPDVTSALVEKFRSDGGLTGRTAFGEIQGRTALVFDDMIASGATLAHAADAVRRHGASRVIAVATHGIFCGDADRVLDGAPIDQLIVTDSVSAGARVPRLSIRKLRIVSIAPLLAEAIHRLHRGESTDELSTP